MTTVVNYDSDASSSEVEEDILQTELSKISDIVKQLDNFTPIPKKNKVGRPKLNPTPPKPDESPVSRTLRDICALVQNIIKRLNSVQKENDHLKNRITTLEQVSPNSNTADNNTPTTLPRTTFASVVANANIPANRTINNFDTRLDQIEQDSYSATLKLDGDLIKDKIRKLNEEETKDYIQFNKSIVREVNKIQSGLLKEEEVDYITIIGKEKKHLKVKLKSSATKINILRTLKENKPDNFYGSQYLTKNRAWCLFKLKSIKKHNTNISTVYSYKGSVCSKLVEGDKTFHLNTLSAIDEFIKDHKLNE